MPLLALLVKTLLRAPFLEGQGFHLDMQASVSLDPYQATLILYRYLR